MTSDENAVATTPESKRTAEEEAAVQRLVIGDGLPMLKVTKNGTTQRTSIDHPDHWVGAAMLADALGTTDVVFVNGLLKQLIQTVSSGRGIDEDALNFMFSIVKSFKPTNATEAMLAAQMAAVHMATMTAAARLAGAKTVQEQDIAHRAMTKLMRTFLAQMDAMMRTQTRNVQRIVVEHVMGSSDGGEAGGTGRSRKAVSGPTALARLSHQAVPQLLDEGPAGGDIEPGG